MELVRYREELLKGVRPALIVKEGRKWMQLAVIDQGKLRMTKRPMTDRQYMTPLELNRKTKASLRRLARKRGTSRTVRAAIKAL